MSGGARISEEASRLRSTTLRDEARRWAGRRLPTKGARVPVKPQVWWKSRRGSMLGRSQKHNPGTADDVLNRHNSPRTKIGFPSAALPGWMELFRMDTTKNRWNKYPIGALLALLVACGGERSLVEQFQEGAWQPEPFQVASLSGRRDGTQVFFSLELHGEGDRRLVLEGTVEIDPQARLVSGRWVEEMGSGSSSGNVSASALDFLGGQGGRPGLGGQFTLAAAGAPLYRLNLPTTRLELRREPGQQFP